MDESKALVVKEEGGGRPLSLVLGCHCHSYLRVSMQTYRNRVPKQPNIHMKIHLPGYLKAHFEH
eukprot:11710851-Ditylum_brightwellii.AAC.1